MSKAISRREVICGLAGAGWALAAPRGGIYNPELLADTAIWVREAERRKRRLAEIVDEAMASMQRAGYGRLDLAAEFLEGGTRARTIAALGRLRLEPAVVSMELEIHRRESADAAIEQVMETARAVMGRSRFIGFRCAGGEKTAGEVEFQAFQLNRLGRELRREGMGLIFRHQAAEMRENARIWRHALANTEPKNVAFSVDVEQAVRGGVNPRQLIEMAGPRLASVYLRNMRQGVSLELLGEGDIQLAEIAATLQQMMYDGLLVVSLAYDQRTERRNSLTADLTRSRWYAHEVFGGRPGQLPVQMGPHVRARK